MEEEIWEREGTKQEPSKHHHMAGERTQPLEKWSDAYFDYYVYYYNVFYICDSFVLNAFKTLQCCSLQCCPETTCEMLLFAFLYLKWLIWFIVHFFKFFKVLNILFRFKLLKVHVCISSESSVCVSQVKKYLQRSNLIRRRLMLKCWRWITQLIMINLHPHQACRPCQGCSGPDSPVLRRKNVRLNSPNFTSSLMTRYTHTHTLTISLINIYESTKFPQNPPSCYSHG